MALEGIIAVTVTATGTVYTGRMRLKAVHFVDGAGAGSIIYRDGGASGVVKLELTTKGGTFEFIPVPGNGILFETDMHVTLVGVTSLTSFCG